MPVCEAHVLVCEAHAVSEKRDCRARTSLAMTDGTTDAISAAHALKSLSTNLS